MTYFHKTHISNIIQIKMARYDLELDTASPCLASIAPSPIPYPSHQRAMYNQESPHTWSTLVIWPRRRVSQPSPATFPIDTLIHAASRARFLSN